MEILTFGNSCPSQLYLKFHQLRNTAVYSIGKPQHHTSCKYIGCVNVDWHQVDLSG